MVGLSQWQARRSGTHYRVQTEFRGLSFTFIDLIGYYSRNISTLSAIEMRRPRNIALYKLNFYNINLFLNL